MRTRIAAGAALSAVLAMVTGGGIAGADGAAHALRPAQLVIVSDRDGDRDVYSISADGRRVGALTRNAADDPSDWPVLLSPVGGWVAMDRLDGAVLVRSDGRYEQKFGSYASANAFSPDGRWLALDRENVLTERSQVELVPVGFAAKTRRLGPGQPLVFSKDGHRLAFDNDNAGVIDVRTGRRTIVSSQLPQFPYQLHWSPNLTGLIVQREDEVSGNGALLFFRAARGATARVMASGRFGLETVAWLDEHRVGFDRDLPDGVSELVVTRVDGRGQRVIARRPTGWSRWAPDGRRVAYSVRDRYGVTIASTSTSARRTIDLGSRKLHDWTWSPSGRRLALEVRGSKRELVIVDVGSGRTVSRRVDSLDEMAWAPDESALALSVSEGGVQLLSFGGGRPHTVWSGGNTTIVGWMRGRHPAGIAAAAPAPQPEVTTASGFRSRARVLEISSAGEWVGAILEDGPVDGEHVVAWTAKRRALVRFTRAVPGSTYGEYHQLSMVGTTLTWLHHFCGNYCYTADCTADARKPATQRCGEQREADAFTRPSPARESKRGVEIRVRAGAIELRRPADGRTRTIRPPGRLVDAELEEMGLFYAHDAGGKFRGRVVFIPFAVLFR